MNIVRQIDCEKDRKKQKYIYIRTQIDRQLDGKIFIVGSILIDGYIAGRIDSQIDNWFDRQLNSQRDRFVKMDSSLQMDIQLEGQIDRQIAGLIDIKTVRWIDLYSWIDSCIS